MSTPRQKCPCGYDYCGYYVDENGEVVEGVKPLEPTRQEFEKWGARGLGWRNDDLVRESRRFHSGESYESPETQVAWLAWKAEGAAAPLEPITARQWLISGGGGHEDGEDGIRACTMPMEHAIELMDEFAEFRAAAVSKNLQRYENAINNHLCEYDAADWLACRGCHTKGDGKVYCVVCEENGDHAHKERELLQARILELEKEIVALRETKP